MFLGEGEGFKAYYPTFALADSGGSERGAGA